MRASSSDKIPPAAVWLLRMAERGFSRSTLSTFSCPDPIDATALAGLIRRGWIEENANLIARITPAGQNVLDRYRRACGLDYSTVRRRWEMPHG